VYKWKFFSIIHVTTRRLTKYYQFELAGQLLPGQFFRPTRSDHHFIIYYLEYPNKNNEIKTGTILALCLAGEKLGEVAR
jgi:hypothetical protein